MQSKYRCLGIVVHSRTNAHTDLWSVEEVFVVWCRFSYDYVVLVWIVGGKKRSYVNQVKKINQLRSR